jgi:hypothetical protein
VRIVRVSPADGATGISTLPTIAATLSTAPPSLSAASVSVIITEAANPEAVLLLQPSFDPATLTLTATPGGPLKSHTTYKLVISIQLPGDAPRVSSSQFTTA